MPPRHNPAAPLNILLNASSGHDDAQATYARIGQLLAESGRAHRIEMVERGADIPLSARRIVANAMSQGGVVVAAGGDGTINAVAQAAHDAGCPMGVLPQGTFNYFSRTHGIPSDTGEATQALLRAAVESVQVGRVNERIFLVNASLGLYPEVLQDREQYKRRFGRHRIVALVSALDTLLHYQHRLRLRIELGGQVRDVRSTTLFVGNNRLQMEQVGLPQANAIEHGRVAAIMLKPTSTWQRLRVLVRGAAGALTEDERVEAFQFQQMTVRPRLPSGRVKVAMDGEICEMRGPLHIGVSPRPLYLLKPPSAHAGVAADAAAAPAEPHAAAHL